MDEIQWEAINAGSYLPARTVNITAASRGAVEMMRCGYTSLRYGIRRGRNPAWIFTKVFLLFFYLISSAGGEIDAVPGSNASDGLAGPRM